MSALEGKESADTSPSTAVPSHTAAKPQRVLACVLCQQRKVKCDRKFPCANCIKADVQCVPATLTPRQRRRRFPERELLKRIRHYEDLLRKNNIEFEPLHAPASGKTSSSSATKVHSSGNDTQSGARAISADESFRGEMTVKSESDHKNKNIWELMNRKPENLDEDFLDDDDSDSSADDPFQSVVARALDQLYENNDHFLFGSSKSDVNLSTLHPEQVQIFRLWQIYLNNVNPLLKVTHTPTLQASILDAAGDVTSISPALEALMLSIYCVSIQTLDDDECRTMFGLTKKDLLTTYQFGCQQALLNCEISRTSDRDCLTAFYLYLVSVRPGTDPRSLSSMLAIAIRIAQRMGMHNESSNLKFSALEAEMRRRLWWSLTMFDTRNSEMSGNKPLTLIPTWDCKVPLNINDFDLQPEMNKPPAVHANTTEALFAVVRSEIGNYMRYCPHHLEFTNHNGFKSLHTDDQQRFTLEARNIATLKEMIEDKYLKFCNPENPLHFMTIYLMRGQMAKSQLVEYYLTVLRLSDSPPDAERDIAFSNALTTLECDTKLMTSHLTKGYLWFLRFHFPFPAYLHLVLELKKRPIGELADKAWEIISDNWEVRVLTMEQRADNPLQRALNRNILQAWAARRSASKQRNEQPEMPPRIILGIQQKMTPTVSTEDNSYVDQQPPNVAGMNSDDFPMSGVMDFESPDPLYGVGGQMSIDSGSGGFFTIPGQPNMGLDMSQLDWNAIDWNSIYGYGW